MKSSNSAEIQNATKELKAIRDSIEEVRANTEAALKQSRLNENNYWCSEDESDAELEEFDDDFDYENESNEESEDIEVKVELLEDALLSLDETIDSLENLMGYFFTGRTGDSASFLTS